MENSKPLAAIFIAVLALGIVLLLFFDRQQAEAPLIVPAEAYEALTEAPPEPAEYEAEEPDEPAAGYENGYITIGGDSYSTALEVLILEGMGLQNEDLAPLAHMENLIGIALRHNEISDLSVFAEHTSLEWMNLADNEISDISPLAELPNLYWLNLSDNQISDISPLAELSLGFLDISDNEIDDISPLSDLDLGVLWLGGNPVTDFSPVEHVQYVQGRPHNPGDIVFAISTDRMLQGHEVGMLSEGDGSIFWNNPFMQQAGAPHLEIIESPYGNAIRVTNRSNNWYAVDLALSQSDFFNFHDHEYEITVYGRNINDDSILFALAAMDGPWNWLNAVEVPAGEEFTLTTFISYDVLSEPDEGSYQFLQRGFRLLTPCLRDYVIYDIIVTFVG